MTHLIVWVTASTILLLLTTFLLGHLQRTDRLQARIDRVGDPIQVAGDPTHPVTGALSAAIALLSNFGRVVLESGLLSGKTLRELSDSLREAGFGADSALRLFIACKVILIVALPLLTLVALMVTGVLPRLHLVAMAATAVIGLMLPDLVIRRLRARTLVKLDAGLADALDLMVICTEAGLGLEPTIARVALEIRLAHPAMADEMERLSNELQLISDPRVALTNIGARTGLIGLKRLASTLSQSLQYGTPLANSLRVLSVEMRTETLLRFEERAAKLPVLLTMPMIVFILPTIFLVVGGPAAIQVLHTMHHH